MEKRIKLTLFSKSSGDIRKDGDNSGHYERVAVKKDKTKKHHKCRKTKRFPMYRKTLAIR